MALRGQKLLLTTLGGDPGGRNGADACSADFTLRLPNGPSLDITTGSGAVTGEGLDEFRAALVARLDEIGMITSDGRPMSARDILAEIKKGLI